MTVQAVTGLLWPASYRDAAWIAATWYGNDWITLIVAVPMLAAGLISARRGSARGTLLWLGALGYAAYNYAFYLLGAVVNPFFPLYAGCVILATIALIRALSATTELGAHFQQRGAANGASARVPGGYLVFVGTGLAAVWLGMWGAHVFAARALPVDEPVFRLVAALDMVMMVPALVAGGILLWRRHPWGFVIAPIAAIQGALYLTVLSTNTLVLARRELGAWPGELVIWGPLAVATSAAAAWLLVLAGGDNNGRP